MLRRETFGLLSEEFESNDFATAGAELIPPALARVQAGLPGLEISLRVAERDDALGLLRRGMLDVAVIDAHTTPAAV